MTLPPSLFLASSSLNSLTPFLAKCAAAEMPPTDPDSPHPLTPSELVRQGWLSSNRTSIIGISVSIIFDGRTRMAGLTVGPSILIRGSARRSGPPSMDSPEPRKMRPRMFCE